MKTCQTHFTVMNTEEELGIRVLSLIDLRRVFVLHIKWSFLLISLLWTIKVFLLLILPEMLTQSISHLLPLPLPSTHPRFICYEEWLDETQNYYYSMALMALQFVIPLSVLVFTYTRIAIAVWGKRPPGEAENLRDQRMARSKRKVSGDTTRRNTNLVH